MSGQRVYPERLLADTDWSDVEAQPRTAGVILQGRQGRLLTTVHIPGGLGPHPAILFCHGMPGTERLVEFGAALRQVGFLTVHFHYSGSWGSDGLFSLDHCLEDANTVLDWMLNDRELDFDPERLFAVGHSMGGLIAAQLIALRKELRGGALIVPASYGYKVRRSVTQPESEPGYRRAYDAYGAWLRGFDWNCVKSEVGPAPDRYDLEYYAPQLSQKPLLAVAATMDTDIPRELNVNVLTSAIRALGGTRMQELTLRTNHSLGDMRGALKSALCSFFVAQL